MVSDYPVILFYKYVPVADPVEFAESQRKLCTMLNLKGRLLVAHEGINGTLAGTASSIETYLADLKRDARFTDMEIKISQGDAEAFPKLSIKVRPEIVTLNAGPDIIADQDNHLSPAEWKHTLENDPDIVVVDVRNRYESEVGKFENAIACDIDNFRDLPAYTDRLEELKDKKVLMYCTGGIRCEKASALFRSKGFKSVFQLHGGIVTYQKEFGNEHWLGECFVFDQRMTVKVPENLQLISKCAHSERLTTRFMNCINPKCNTLFLLAEETEQGNPDTRFCPECFAQRTTAETLV
ncbi:rhodanese-related sulfurtransferase [soil metagenome]